MVAIGSQHEALTIRNLTAAIDAGSRCGIPTLGVTAVGKELVRDARYLALASRICAENGAHVVKTYYCDEGFEKVAASCPVPIVIAGGKKLPELDALKMARSALDQGACGVDMGRNIFQADNPIAMIQAVKAVVHGNESPAKGLELYQTLKNEKRSRP
jgi:putative autoinducer-2 (AI-2) aldolase